MTRRERILLLELVRGKATRRELEAEGFTCWEIDWARSFVERVDAERKGRRPARTSSFGQAAHDVPRPVVTGAG